MCLKKKKKEQGENRCRKIGGDEEYPEWEDPLTSFLIHLHKLCQEVCKMLMETMSWKLRVTV